MTHSHPTTGARLDRSGHIRGLLYRFRQAEAGGRGSLIGLMTGRGLPRVAEWPISGLLAKLDQPRESLISEIEFMTEYSVLGTDIGKVRWAK
jgi:hypothetical protein